MQGDFPHSDAALDGYAGVSPADAFSPSAAGLYNMLGNTWEWTGTWYAKSSGQRVLRGGSYLDSADGVPIYILDLSLYLDLDIYVDI